MAGNGPLLDLRLKRSKHSCIKGLISVCRHPVGPGHMLSTYKYINAVYFHVVYFQMQSMACQRGPITYQMQGSNIQFLVGFMFATDALHESSCAHKKSPFKTRWNTSSKMHGGQAESNRSFLGGKSSWWCNRGFSSLWFEPLSDTDLFEEVHEARSEAPGFVAVALKGADGHLSGPLGRDSNHEHGVVHQGCVCLRRKRWEEDVVGIFFFLTLRSKAHVQYTTKHQ